jgi:hypothetical protein
MERAAYPPVYDTAEDKITAYGDVGGDDTPLDRLCAVKGSEWEELLPAEYGYPSDIHITSEALDGKVRYSVDGIVFDEERAKTILIVSQMYMLWEGRFGMREIVGKEVRRISYQNPASMRPSAVFGYNPRSGAIMMYGGRLPGRFASHPSHETWEIRYSEESGAYVWRKLGED